LRPSHGGFASNRKLRPTGTLSPQDGHLMSQGNKLKFQRGAAANTEFEDRNKGAENRHHDRHGTAGSRKSLVFVSLVEILSKDRRSLKSRTMSVDLP
jgi:hypothetical protein